MQICLFVFQVISDSWQLLSQDEKQDLMWPARLSRHMLVQYTSDNTDVDLYLAKTNTSKWKIFVDTISPEIAFILLGGLERNGKI